MRPWITAVLLFLVSVTPVWSAPRTITFYLDGAVVEEQITAHAGVAEVRLPAAMQPGSLRIRPSRGTLIEQVELAPAGSEKNRTSETARLAERKEHIADRLKALETREEIFRSAAKSQSGKAPRKTKTNPEPLRAIRQGTDYALAQLEEVYRQQRKVRKELGEVEARLAYLEKGVAPQGAIARISMGGKVKGGIVSYIRTDLAWTPRYDFRFNDAGTVEVSIRPKLPNVSPGSAVSVVLARLADGLPEKPLPEMRVPKEPVRLPVERAVYRGGPGSSLTVALSNTGTFALPPGEASCYWQGEYLGTVAFPGCGPGEAREVAVGAVSRPSEPASP